MPRSTNVPDSIRLFVAAYPPAELAADLLRKLQRLPLPEAIRHLKPDQIHLTLQFIGETELHHVKDVTETVLCAGKGIPAFELTPLQIAAWPQNMATKRIFAVETDSPSPLRELHRRLSNRLAKKPRGEGDDRFVPHMTLARFERPSMFEHKLDLDSPSFLVDRYVLMSSELKRDGAQHRQIQSFPLDGR